MEESLSIGVEVTGTRDLAELLKKLDEGKLTLKEITQLKKELNATFKEVKTGTAEWTKYAGAMAKVNDFQRDVRIATRAGHEQYFKLGLEVRQLTLASGLLSGNLGKLSDMMSGAVSGAIGLKQALVPLGIQFGGIALGITALIALLPQLITLYKELAEKSKLAYGSQKTFLSAIFEQAEGGDFQGARDRLEARYKALRGIGDTEALKSMGISSESDMLRIAAELKKAAATGRRDRTRAERKDRKSMGEQPEGAFIDPTQFDAEMDRMAFEIEDTVDKAVDAGLEEGFDGADLSHLEQTLGRMFSRVSNVFASEMGAAWESIFGEANSLFEKLLQSMVESISSIFATYAIGSLLSLAGGGPLGAIGGSMLKGIGLAGGGVIDEPVAGIGLRTGRSWAFGEMGPEYVTPMHDMSAGRNGGKTFIEIKAITRGDDLRYIIDRVNRKRDARITF